MCDSLKFLICTIHWKSFLICIKHISTIASVNIMLPYDKTSCFLHKNKKKVEKRYFLSDMKFYFVWNNFRDWGRIMDGRKNAEYQNSRITKLPKTLIAPICNFGSILKHFSSTFQSHLCKEWHVHVFVLTMQLWIYSEAFLKHFSITSL
jgi:hypothetical protein